MATVALVERSRTQRKLVRLQLQEDGHDVLEAENAAQARCLMNENNLDAVLLAWELDDEPAPTLLRHWQTDQRARFVPVLMVTSHDDPKRVFEALSLGAMDFLRKPVNRVELAARLSAALRTRRLELQLHEQATRDPLTKLFNRREFQRLASGEMRRCRRYQRPASLCILDLDHFKSINDTFGHDAGDQVLQQMADLLRRGTRDVDVVGRHGGEEFTVLLPETPAVNAVICMTRLLETVRAAVWLEGRREVTFSCGVTDLSSDELDTALRRADQALYRAKDEGRNRVLYSAPGTEG